MNNKKTKIRIFNICFFVFILLLTFYVVFRKSDISLILANIKKVNLKYILLAIIFMFVYVSCEGINIKRVLKTLNHKVSFLDSYKYACVGFFFSAITPSASGGDPAQLYFMSKDNLPISHCALALLVELTSFQLITCFLAVFGLVNNYDILINRVGNLKYLMFIGLFINILYIMALLILIFSKKVALKILEYVFKFLCKIDYKKREDFYNKAVDQIEEYHNCSMFLKNNKLMLFKVILTTLFELLIYHTVPYFIYLSFGLSRYNIFKFISMGAILYTSVAFLPFPGSMGVSEGSFVIMFKMLFPYHLLSSAMLISRGVSFYLFVILTGVLILIYYLINKYKETKV